jgi:hypothetical protein
MIARIRSSMEVLSRIMGRVWLTVLYFTAIAPFGLAARLRAARRFVPANPDWLARKDSASHLDEARRQF